MNILRNAVRAVVRSGLVTGGVDGQLLAKQIGAGRGEREFVTSPVGIIESEVMVVLEPIGRRVGKKIDHARESELLVPFLAKLGEGLSRMRKRKVVVDGITCPDEKIGLQFLHGGEGGIAEALVLLRCGYRPTAVGDAG